MTPTNTKLTKQDAALRYYLAQLRTLIGYKITGIATDEDEEFFGLKLTHPDGTTKILFLLSDDEANGPGSFEIQDL